MLQTSHSIESAGDSEMFNMDYTVVDAYRKVICHSLQR